MKITNITDVEGFFRMIDSCEGKVELITGEGDCLNLKSRLSQYVGFAKLFADELVPEVELKVSNRNDMQKMMDFMTNGGKCVIHNK